MVSFLNTQLQHFGQDVRSGRWQADDRAGEFPRNVSEMVATALHLLDRLEKSAAAAQPSRPDWSPDEARRFVPAFQVWLEHASAVLEQVRECRNRGFTIERAEEFVHRYNIARLMGEDFEKTVAIYLSREPAAQRRGIPLDEVEDELRRRAGSGRH
ncbi:MAG TPA: hypothetical protein VN541_06735 [Tepidisphaeraceae bacterium]|nr:hypothetical protein [Tepidisphaeraceae bacterium]